MAGTGGTHLGSFETVFNKSVPHILEKIFFSLDYDSFMECKEVCKAWNDLFSSEHYKRRSEKMLVEKMENEQKLCNASFGGNVEEVRHLLSIGVNPNCRESDHLRLTPLIKAAWRNRKDIVKLLLDRGADPNMGDANGTTPLILAHNKGHPAVIELLLGAGADINKANNMGSTVLHEAAARWDNLGYVQMLLEAGADPNVENRSGVTPLSIALRDRDSSGYDGYRDVIALLQMAQTK